MGKTRVKVQIDSNDIFYDGVHTDVSKSKIMRSQLWPVIVAMYSFVDRRIQVGPSVLSDNAHTIHLLTRSGLPVAIVHNDPDNIHILTSDNIFAGGGVGDARNYTTRLQTNNVRYAVAKLGPNAFHNIREDLHNTVAGAEKAYNEITRTILDNMVDRFAGRSMSKPTIRVTSEVATALARVLIGGEPMDNINEPTLRDLRKSYDDYVASHEFFERMVDTGAAMFTSNKWVVTTGILGGIVVGAISNQPMLVAFNEYKKSGYLPQPSGFSFIDQIVPFKWYKNLAAVPEDIRSGLEVSAMMLKTHANSTSSHFLPVDTVESGLKIWDSVEALGWNTWHSNNSSIFIFNT